MRLAPSVFHVLNDSDVVTDTRQKFAWQIAEVMSVLDDSLYLLQLLHYHSLIYVYLAPIVNVEPILQGKIAPSIRLDATILFPQRFGRRMRQSGTTYHRS